MDFLMFLSFYYAEQYNSIPMLTYKDGSILTPSDHSALLSFRSLAAILHQQNDGIVTNQIWMDVTYEHFCDLLRNHMP